MKLDKRRTRRFLSRLWREWCFFRVLARHFRTRFLIMLSILGWGGFAFMKLEPEQNHSPQKAVFYAWSLIFGEPPEAFPESLMLQVLFFVVPVLGLTVIIEGIVDFAFVLRDRRQQERGWCRIMAGSLKDHIVLVGAGRLGYRIFGLLRELGEHVVVIERDSNNQFLETIRQEGAPLFVNDARQETCLEDANVPQAKSIILATNDDLANLEIALDARRIAPGIRVVLRMFDQNMADKIRDGFDIRIAMSQSAISAPAFAGAAIEASVLNSQLINDQLIVMQRWHVHEDGPLCDKTVSDVLADYGFSVVEHKTKDDVRLFPPPSTQLQKGDRLLVQGTFEAFTQLKEMAKRLT